MTYPKRESQPSLTVFHNSIYFCYVKRIKTHGNINIFIEDTFRAKERDILDIRHRNKDFGENI